MNLHEANEKIAAKLEELSAPMEEAGLKVEARILYADRTLREYSEFNDRCILVYGDIAIGTEELERDEYCNFSICCEVKTGLVDDTELEKELNDLDGEIVAFTEGKKLDELHKAVEVGKRPYQNILKVIITAVVTAAVCFLIGFMMHIFLN